MLQDVVSTFNRVCRAIKNADFKALLNGVERLCSNLHGTKAVAPNMVFRFVVVREKRQSLSR